MMTTMEEMKMLESNITMRIRMRKKRKALIEDTDKSMNK